MDANYEARPIAVTYDDGTTEIAYWILAEVGSPPSPAHQDGAWVRGLHGRIFMSRDWAESYRAALAPQPTVYRVHRLHFERGYVVAESRTVIGEPWLDSPGRSYRPALSTVTTHHRKPNGSPFLTRKAAERLAQALADGDVGPVVLAA